MSEGLNVVPVLRATAVLRATSQSRRIIPMRAIPMSVAGMLKYRVELRGFDIRLQTFKSLAS
jgi:hypothetical protein